VAGLLASRLANGAVKQSSTVRSKPPRRQACEMRMRAGAKHTIFVYTIFV
jgi:hypothetical protein